jgi:hypothetical protein
MSHAARRAEYGTVSTSLSLLSDRQLREFVGNGQPIGAGIGGTTVLLDVGGTPVFVKKVPLTDLERRPENVMSTADLLGLPTFYQYGVGSAGFGAWRELAAHVMTTNWVLGERCRAFPLLYHWRVLPEPPPQPSTPEQRATLERTVAYWAGSPAVRERLEAVARSSASVVLFLEYLPQNLHEWLSAQVALGADATESACAMVEEGLTAGISFMNSRGLLHFDAHFRNILTDGRRLYFSDFGLAMSSRFDLSRVESEFFREHASHDVCYAVTQLVNWLVAALHPVVDRRAFIRACAEGADPAGLPPSAATIVKRYALIAAVMNEFYWKLHTEDRTARYPVAEIESALAAAGFEGVRARATTRSASTSPRT